MSIKIMTWVFDHCEVTGGERLVLLALADNANDEGYCWPSLVTIARKARLTRRATIFCIARLERSGLLQRMRRYDERHTTLNHTNVYRVLWPGVRRSASPSSTMPAAIATPDDGGPRERGGSESDSLGVVNHVHQGSESDSLGVVNHVHQGSESDSPRTSILTSSSEPSLNHQIEPPPPTPSAAPARSQEGDEVFPRAREAAGKLGVFDGKLPGLLAQARARGWTEDGLLDLTTRLEQEYGKSRAASLWGYRILHEDPVRYGYARYNTGGATADDWGVCPRCYQSPCACAEEGEDEPTAE